VHRRGTGINEFADLLNGPPDADVAGTVWCRADLVGEGLRDFAMECAWDRCELTGIREDP